MAKIVLEDLTNLRNEASVVAAINRNNAKIEAAIENTLSRDGTTPNTMQTNLDMNSSRIINLSDPVNDNDLATKEYVDTAILGEVLGSGVVLTAAGRALLDDADANTQLDTLGGGGIGKELFQATSASEAREALGLVDAVANSYTKVIHADSYGTLAEAIAALTDNTKLLLQGGKTYTHSAGQFTSFPNNFCIDSDNGLPWVIDFSGNTAWYPTGLFGVSSSLEAATEEALTANLIATTDSVQASSATAVGQTVTMNATSHGLVTGDWVFIRYGGVTTAGQAAYCTEYDSDEGQALDKPVQVTRITDDQFTYTAYSGTPDATMTIFPFIYKNNQVAKVASSADYAVGDLVFIESTDSFQVFTGTQTVGYAELNEVGRIIDSTTIWLRLPVRFTYNTSASAKITKVTKKRPVFMNGKIIGNGVNPTKPYYTYSDIGTLFHLCYRPLLVNMQFEQCDFMGNWMRSCFYPLLINCLDTKPMEDSAGRSTGKIETEYGFAYGNATRGYLAIDCEARGGRHGFDEVSTATYKGMTVDWTLVRPRAYDQWSTNIDTHGTAWDGKIIDPVIRGGDGIACRNGSLICTGIRAYGSKRAFNAYGRVTDVIVSVDDADCTLQDVVSIAPSTDIATPTPDSTGVKILHVNSRNGGVIGVRIASPANHKFIAPYIGPIQCDGVSSYALYMTTASGAEIVSPHVVSVSSENFGSYVAYLGKVTNGYFGKMFGRKSGNFTVCVVSDSATTGNTFDNVSGVSTSGGTVTKFSMPSTSTGNFTNSLDYESKTIASGAITKNWRNVPLTIVDTEGAAASDDLDTVNGLSSGDLLFIRTSTSARDVNLTNAGNLRQPIPRLLTDTGQVQQYVNNGSSNITSDYGRILYGSATYDTPSLASGASATTTVTVTGAALGDFVRSVSFGVDTQGLDIEYRVSSADTVSIRIHNHTGGTIDLSSTTIRVLVEKAT